MTTVLFVCTANRFRSALAAKYFEKKLAGSEQHNIQVQSAGTWGVNGQPATSDALQLAQAAGLDLKNHLSKIVTSEILSNADLIVVMEMGHKEAIIHEFPKSAQRVHLLSDLVRGVDYNIPDPYMTEESPDKIAYEIFCLIDQGYENIVKTALNF
jgi:protein-tyrosine phosphatase